MEFFLKINIYAWSALINLFLCLFFGSLIFLHNPKKRLYQTFFFLNLVIVVWSFGYFFWQTSDTYSKALFWTRILSIGSTLIPPALLHWTLSLLGLYRKGKKIVIFFYLLAIIFILFGFTEAFVRTVEPNFLFKFWPKPGSLYSVYLFLTYVPIILCSSYLISRKYIESKGVEKSRLRWVTVGTLLALFGGSTNFPLWYNIPVPPLGNFLVATYPIFFSYSMSRYRFMDIKSLITRSLTFGLIVLFITATFAAISGIIALFFEGLIGVKSNIIAGLVVGVLVSLAYQPSRRLIEQVTNSFLYKKRYNPDELLSKITEVTSSILNFDQLLGSMTKTLIEAFGAAKLGIALLDKKAKLYIAYQQGFDGGIEKFVKGKEKFLPLYFAKSQEIQVIDELKARYEAGEYQPKSVELLLGLYNLDIALIVPLFTKEKLIGIIAVGTKKSGDPYNQQDLNIFEIIAGQAAIAIENARLYEEQKQFAVILQQKVEAATKELRSANIQLKELDRAKSDFISIASHQLRTPLTVIKGYISMMEEGSFGKVPPKISEQLKKVFISNERLIGLIESLLDISRIESGRQEYKWEKIRLEDLASQVVDNLKKNARDKGLKLFFHKPTKPTPQVLADAAKLHEVMMNFVDNAIKYTKKGKIDVIVVAEPKGLPADLSSETSVEEEVPTEVGTKAGMVTFSVKDTGIGVAKETMIYLFKKFSRVKGSFLVHTEGVGLGLFVAKMLIDAHHGIIGVESAGKDKGSRFFFSIPIQGPESKEFKPQEAVCKYLGKGD